MQDAAVLQVFDLDLGAQLAARQMGEVTTAKLRAANSSGCTALSTDAMIRHFDKQLMLEAAMARLAELLARGRTRPPGAAARGIGGPCGHRR